MTPAALARARQAAPVRSGRVRRAVRMRAPGICGAGRISAYERSLGQSSAMPAEGPCWCGRRMADVHIDALGRELLDHAVDAKCATAVPVGVGKEERRLVRVVLEAVGVQRVAGVHRHALVRCAEGSSPYRVRVRTWSTYGGPGRCGGSGYVREHCLQGLLVAGQHPPDDSSRRPVRILGNGDAVGFLDGVEVVRLDVHADGGERRDDDLVRVPGPVGHVQPLVGRPVEHGVVGEDVLADDIVDKTGVPELLGTGGTSPRTARGADNRWSRCPAGGRRGRWRRRTGCGVRLCVPGGRRRYGVSACAVAALTGELAAEGTVHEPGWRAAAVRARAR